MIWECSILWKFSEIYGAKEWDLEVKRRKGPSCIGLR